jgi:hypothetical protein
MTPIPKQISFWHRKHFFLLLLYLYFLSHNFILRRCVMVGKICGGQKKVSLGWGVLFKVRTKTFIALFTLTVLPLLHTSPHNPPNKRHEKSERK